MNIKEYNKVKDLNYLDYCSYLQNKYGLSPTYYCTRGWNPIVKAKRTKDGLFIHHKYENKEIMLCKKEYAQKHDYEWQSPINLVYCDYLEHLLLHILICESDAMSNCGVGGVISFIVPELNDYYSGYIPKKGWMNIMVNKVKDDFDVYRTLIKRFVNLYHNLPSLKQTLLRSSYVMHDKLHLQDWTNENNKRAYQMINEVFKEYE